MWQDTASSVRYTRVFDRRHLFVLRPNRSPKINQSIS